MATYYSDHFSGVNPDTGAEDNSVLSKTKYPPDGIGGGRMRYARAEVTLAAATASGVDVRLMQLRSGDRLNSIFITSTDSGSTGSFDLGVWKSGISHDGVKLEANVFVAVKLLTSALAHLEVLSAGAPAAIYKRGKTLWETLEGGSPMPDGDYSVDPGEDWDLVLTTKATIEDATQIIIEVLYTSEG